MVGLVSERTRQARALFAPLGPTYDRYARVLSLGQDPRWRRFLVSRIDAGAEDTVLDVATGTAAVALGLVRTTGCSVVGVDQSAEMLEEARRRIRPAGTEDRIRLVEARAESLPFEDEAFSALTFTYLLRYVDDPGQTLRELARVTRRRGTIASLEFGIPSHGATRALWTLYVGSLLPLLGRAIGSEWAEVGRFLHGSICEFYARLPLQHQLALWEEAGIGGLQMRRLSLGGGIVIWGRRR